MFSLLDALIDLWFNAESLESMKFMPNFIDFLYTMAEWRVSVAFDQNYFVGVSFWKSGHIKYSFSLLHFMKQPYTSIYS